MDARLPKFLFVLLVLFAAVHFSSYYSLLPDVVQSHFNGQGQPNGWQTKTVFFSFLVGVTVLASFFAFGLPALISALPVQLFNLPHKDYWFSPERRPASLAFITSWFAWYGCAVYLLAIFTFDYAIQSNLHPDHRPAPAGLAFVLIAFLAFTAFWILRIFRRFSQPAPGASLH